MRQTRFRLYHRFDKKGADPFALLKQLKDLEVTADVEATVDFLKNHEAVNGDSMGITGFCMGGRVAYLMAAVIPAFKASVAYYGGNTMVPRGEDFSSPFERTAEISCPLLFHFGKDDKNPSSEDRENSTQSSPDTARTTFSTPTRERAMPSWTTPAKSGIDRMPTKRPGLGRSSFSKFI